MSLQTNLRLCTKLFKYYMNSKEQNTSNSTRIVVELPMLWRKRSKMRPTLPLLQLQFTEGLSRVGIGTYQ